MNNGLPGPNTTDTVTGGKTLELSKYDKVRRPHKAITDQTKIRVTARTLSTELCCPICLDLLTCTMTTKECLHRFCSECITTALMRGNKECPTCRKKIVSKRSLRPDPNFDFLISKIWPDRKLYDAELNASMQLFQEQSNVAALQKSIEEGIRAQAAYRKQRVQGSYDYEKRKRRPPKLVDPNAGPMGSSSSSSVAAAVDGAEQLAEPGELVEQLVVSLTPVEGLEVNSPAEARQAQLNSSSSDESDTDSSSDDSSDLSSDSSMSDSSSEFSNPSTTRSSVEPNQNGQQKEPIAAAGNGHRQNRRSSNSPAIADDAGIEMAAEEMRRRSEEIELELAPSKALLSRRSVAVPALLNCSHFIRAPSQVTMDHLGEFLHRISLSAATNSQSQQSAEEKETQMEIGEEMAQPQSTRPQHFYILDRRHQLRRLEPHEMLCDAFLSSIHWDRHLIIFFDLEESNDGRREELSEVIGEELAKMVLGGAGGMKGTEAEEEERKKMKKKKDEEEKRKKQQHGLMKEEPEEEEDEGTGKEGEEGQKMETD